MYQTNCYVVIFEWFLGQAGFHADIYARHYAALRGVRTVRSLSNDYAAMLSACPGVRYQTVLFIYIIVEHLVLKYIIRFHLSTWRAIRVILCHLNVSWPPY